LKRKALTLCMVLAFSVLFCGSAWAGYSITISKASNKLALYRDGSLIRVFPVATGRHPSFTPEGTFTIVCKLIDPYYTRGKIPGGSPRNPLGPRWLGLNVGGGGTYGIHGNNNPASIGTYASGGCIRMYNKDVIWLFDRVPAGTPVTINNIPINRSPRTAAPGEPKPRPIKLLVGDIIIPLPDNRQPEERNKHIFIPLRPAVEKLGYKLVWHYEYNIIEIRKAGEKAFIDAEGDSAMVNGRFYRLPVKGTFKEGVLYLPLEFFNLLPGITAEWDEKNRQVMLAYN